MDNTTQVFATGGASGGVAVAIYMTYKFLTSHHRVRSVCCGRSVDIETEAPTSPVKSQVLVEDARPNKITTHLSIDDPSASRRGSLTKSENTSGVLTDK